MARRSPPRLTPGAPPPLCGGQGVSLRNRLRRRADSKWTSADHRLQISEARLASEA